jgi:toxin ParE2
LTSESKPLRLHEAAYEEIEHAESRYRSERSELGDEFLDEITVIRDRIRSASETFGLAPDGPRTPIVRQALLRRFPYRLVFIDASDAITVIAIAHQHRQPGYWRKRLSTP